MRAKPVLQQGQLYLLGRVSDGKTAIVTAPRDQAHFGGNMGFVQGTTKQLLHLALPVPSHETVGHGGPWSLFCSAPLIGAAIFGRN